MTRMTSIAVLATALTFAACGGGDNRGGMQMDTAGGAVGGTIDTSGMQPADTMGAMDTMRTDTSMMRDTTMMRDTGMMSRDTTGA